MPRPDKGTMKPLAIDLFCGLGGWAEGFLREGYRVVGFDNNPRFAKLYPGEFVLADVRSLDGRRFRDARCIVASPPCNEFTRLNFLRSHAPPPDTTLVEACWRIAQEARVPVVMENVEGARRYIGPAVAHRGSWYLWGDVPILFDGHLPPKVGGIPRRANPWVPRGDGTRPARLYQWGHGDKGRDGSARRAKIPLPLARAVARGFL